MGRLGRGRLGLGIILETKDATIPMYYRCASGRFLRRVGSAVAGAGTFGGDRENGSRDPDDRARILHRTRREPTQNNPREPKASASPKRKTSRKRSDHRGTR